MFHLDLAPDLTPPPRALMLPPKDMESPDTTARGPLMPRLTPVSSMELMAMLVCPMLDMLPMELTPTPMEPTPTCMVSPSDPALVLTPSPRALTPSPRELSPRGLLMLMPLSSMELTDTLTPTPTPTPMFPSAPAPVLTPSPRALMLPPRDMPPTDTDSPDMPMESKSCLRRDQQPNKLLFMIAATDN